MRLYVTGGTGLVGSNVIKLALERYDAEVIATQFGPEPEWDVTYELIPLDMGDHAAIKASIKKYKPDVVIHCAALLDQVFMYEKRALSWSIMVDGARAFAEACREVGARFVFVSSDWVFDGQEPMVDEDSPPFPINFYGVMKMATERDLEAMDGLNYGVGRLAGVYGLNYSNPSLLRKDNGLGFDFGNFVIDHISKGLVAPVWMGPKVNDVANPTLASDGADMLLRLAQHDGNGIFHCFGSEPVSRLQFAHHLADLFEVDHALIAPIPTDPQVLDAHRHIGIPFRTRASTEKTSQALGRKSFGILEGLKTFKQEWDAFFK
jgi:dTDP-4-dehydrorhamnose reductase